METLHHRNVNAGSHLPHASTASMIVLLSQLKALLYESNGFSEQLDQITLFDGPLSVLARPRSYYDTHSHLSMSH